MRKIISLLSCVALATLVSVSCKDKASAKVAAENVANAAQRNEVDISLPVLRFQKSEHDFGTIIQGTPQQTTFTFTNTGNAPLVITDAKSTCGCTIPEYPKNVPIAPGESGELTVKFNGTGQNQVTKTILLITNTQNVAEQLRIKAFVTPKKGL